MPANETALQRMWHALGEDGTHLSRVEPGGEPALASRLPAAALTWGAVAASSLAAARLAADAPDRASSGAPAPRVTLNADRLLTAVTSERHFRLDGAAGDVWADLSGFWRCGDSWVRTHANYPHHRARLLGVLGLPADAGTGAFEDRLATLDPVDLEERAAEAGAVAYAVRTQDEWERHPEAEAVRRQPLITRERLGESAPTGRPAARHVAAPLAGIRVLDLTRVIAGPIATRTLALLGADVLRVDTPTVPEMSRQHLDTGPGKRSTLLDLTRRDDARTFEGLLETADVVVTGYRPGALARFGLEPGELAERRPGLVVGRVSAWSDTGPWAGRRGFDSIVQAVSGIAWVESPDGVRPGALPAQALDHTAGYLLAACILSSLRRTHTEGGSRFVGVSLARIAQELLTLPRDSGEAAEHLTPGEPTTVTMAAPDGAITCALPALSYAGAQASWTAPPHPWGSDSPDWVSRR